MSVSSVPPQAKAALPVTDFYSFRCSVMEASFYGGHILKLEQCREDQHDPCVRMTRKFLKCSKISNDNAVTCLPYCQQVGLHVDLLCAGSNYIQPRPAAVILCSSMVGGEGADDWWLSATTSKGHLASDMDLHIQVQGCGRVFAAATHILKLKRYRGDQHGPCARMTLNFLKRSKFPTISSDTAGTHLPYCQQVRLYIDLLSAGSIYIKPRPAAGISCCSVVERGRGWEVEQITDSPVLLKAKTALLMTSI